MLSRIVFYKTENHLISLNDRNKILLLIHLHDQNLFYQLPTEHWGESCHIHICNGKVVRLNSAYAGHPDRTVPQFITHIHCENVKPLASMDFGYSLRTPFANVEHHISLMFKIFESFADITTLLV